MALGVVNIRSLAAGQSVPNAIRSNLLALNPDTQKLYVLDYLINGGACRIKISDNAGTSWSNLTGDLTIYNFPRLLYHKLNDKLYIISTYNNPSLVFNIQKFNAVNGSSEGTKEIVAKTEDKPAESLSASMFVSDWDISQTTEELIGIYMSYSNSDNKNWISYIQKTFNAIGIGSDEFKIIDERITTFNYIPSNLENLHPSVCVSDSKVNVVYYLRSGSSSHINIHAVKSLSGDSWSKYPLDNEMPSPYPYGPFMIRCNGGSGLAIIYHIPQDYADKETVSRSLNNGWLGGSLTSPRNNTSISALAMREESDDGYYFYGGSSKYYLLSDLAHGRMLIEVLFPGVPGWSLLNLHLPRRYLIWGNIQRQAIFESDQTPKGLSIIANVVALPHITSTANINAIIGLPYKYDSDSKAQATGDGIIWSADVGAPSGFSINSSTGLISWTPDATGSFSYTIRATNIAGYDTQPVSVTVVVDNPPVISNISPANGSADVSKNVVVSFTLTDAETNVDQSSIIVKVNGSVVSYSIVQTFANGYRLSCSPPTGGYSEGSTVEVYVKCKDTKNHYLETTFSFTIAYASLTLQLKKDWNMVGIPVDDSVNNQPAYIKVIGTANSVLRLAYKISKIYNPSINETDFNSNPTIGVVDEIRTKDTTTQTIKRWNPSLSLSEINEINGTQAYFIKIKDVVGTGILTVVFTGRLWNTSDLVPSILPLKKGENWINLIPGKYSAISQVFSACADIQEMQRFNKTNNIFESVISGFGGDIDINTVIQTAEGYIIKLKADSTTGLPYK